MKLTVGGEMRKAADRRGFSRFRGDDAACRCQLAEAGLPLNMELKSKQLYWPFSGETVQADDVLLKFNGKMTDYTMAFSTAVKGNRCRRRKITLNAKGNDGG
ncbi:hypothetical protein DMH17_04245 [Raoultella planticola]|nr:hypothetical protein [Raoultella planticola]